MPNTGSQAAHADGAGDVAGELMRRREIRLEVARARASSSGCRCKTGCRNGYCECFKFGLGCTDNCKCLGCQNGDAGRASTAEDVPTQPVLQLETIPPLADKASLAACLAAVATAGGGMVVPLPGDAEALSAAGRGPFFAFDMNCGDPHPAPSDPPAPAEPPAEPECTAAERAQALKRSLRELNKLAPTKDWAEAHSSEGGGERSGPGLRKRARPAADGDCPAALASSASSAGTASPPEPVATNNARARAVAAQEARPRAKQQKQPSRPRARPPAAAAPAAATKRAAPPAPPSVPRPDVAWETYGGAPHRRPAAPQGEARAAESTAAGATRPLRRDECRFCGRVGRVHICPMRWPRRQTASAPPTRLPPPRG